LFSVTIVVCGVGRVKGIRFDLEIGVIVKVLFAHFPKNDILNGLPIPNKNTMGFVPDAAAL
jgi:hypothetical protein